MKKQLFTLAFLLVCLAMQSVFAQISLTTPSVPVVTDFTGFAASGGSATPAAGELDSKIFAVTGFVTGGGPNPAPNNLPFDGTITLPNTDLAGGIRYSSTPKTTAGLYAFSDTTAGNQAILFQPTAADFTPGTLTMRIVNNSGSTMSDLVVNYDWFYWNNGDAANPSTRSQSVRFFYSTDSVNFTEVVALADTTIGAQDTAWHYASVATTISNLIVPTGNKIYIRWQVDDRPAPNGGAGNRDEVGFDNISVSMLANPIVSQISYAATTASGVESALMIMADVQQNLADTCTVEIVDAGTGTATAGADYSLVFPMTVSFDGTSALQSIMIPILDDATIEADETIVLVLQNATGGCAVGLPDTLVATILDDDTPLLYFDSTSVTVSETAGSVNISMTQNIATVCTVDVAVFSGTATNGGDYTLTSPTTVTFDGTNTTTTLNIPLIDDAILEVVENVKIYLTNAVGCAISTPDTMIINITSDDLPPLYPIGLVTTQDANGSPDSLNVRCRLQGVVHGINYRLGAGGLLFSAIDATGSIWVSRQTATLGYTVTEGDEVIMGGQIQQFNGITQFRIDSISIVSTGNALMTPNTIVTMTEADEADLVKIMMVKIINPAQWTTGMGNGGFTVRVTNGGTAITDSFNIRIDNDADLYNLPAPTCEWFNVTGLVYQSDNTAPYTSGYTLYPRYQADIECIPSPDLAFDANANTVSENVGTVTVNVTITNANPDPTDVTITATGTATNGTDYTLGTTMVSFPGNSTANVPVTINVIDDATGEVPETVILTLGSATNAATISQATYTLTINDNEGVGIIPTLDGKAVSVYPNPGTSSFMVKTEVQVNEILVRNSLGQIVLSSKITNAPISAEKLENGIYMIQVMTDKGMWTTKWVKE